MRTHFSQHNIYKASRREGPPGEWCLPMWQVSPCHPTGQRQWPGRMQLPPFPHGGWHIAVGKRGLSHQTQEGPQSPLSTREGLPRSKDTARSLPGSRKWGPALTCSTSPREPAGPFPTRAAGIARTGGSQPRAVPIGSPVDGSVVNKGGSERSNTGWP